jgi:hypothetical protein
MSNSEMIKERWNQKQDERRKRVSIRNERKYYEKVLCMAASTKYSGAYNDLHENTSWVGMYTLSTYCRTNNMEDLIMSTRQQVNHKVTGIAGKDTSSISYKGAGMFELVDDAGTTCSIPVPELYYCNTCKIPP